MKQPALPLRFSARTALLLILTTLPGIAGVLIFGFYALQDWEQLQQDYSHFENVIKQARPMEVLFVAEAQQNVHRINLMADGIWTLLSWILAAIGLHGACLPRR